MYSKYRLSAGTFFSLICSKHFNISRPSNMYWPIFVNLLFIADTTLLDNKNKYNLCLLNDENALHKIQTDPGYKSLVNSLKRICSSYSSKLKNCNEPLPEDSEYLKIAKVNSIPNFRNLLESELSDTMKRVDSFVQKTINNDPIKREEFIKAILGLLDFTQQNSNVTIELQVLPNYEYKYISVNDLLELSRKNELDIDFNYFFAGVWLYLFEFCVDNCIGKYTVNDWLNPENLEKYIDYCSENYNVRKITYNAPTATLNTISSAKIPQKISKNIENELLAPFSTYIEKAAIHNSKKKNVLSTVQCNFADFYTPSHISKVKGEDLLSPFNFLLRLNDNTYEENDDEDEIITSFKMFDRCSIITGIGGLGKTMALNHFLLEALHNVNDNLIIPVVINLSDYKDTASIPDLINKSISLYDNKINKDIIDTLLQNGQFVILMDGLDEIRSSYVDAFIEEIDTLSQTVYNKCQFIITSRLVFYIDSLSGFTRYEIKPLSRKLQLELIDNISIAPNLPENLEAILYEKKQQFKEALINDTFSYYGKDQRKFLGNPLLLSLTFSTFFDNNQIPTRKSSFFDNIYENMISRRKKADLSSIFYTKLSEVTFKNYFAKFCVISYKAKCFSFSKKELHEYISSALDGTNVNPDQFIKDITDKLCFLYLEGERYHFIHRSFQEYFAAYYYSTIENDMFINTLLEDAPIFLSTRLGFENDYFFDFLFELEIDRLYKQLFKSYLEELLPYEYEDDEQYQHFLEISFPHIEYELNNNKQTSVISETCYIENITYRLIVKLINYLYHSAYDNRYDFSLPTGANQFVLIVHKEHCRRMYECETKTDWIYDYDDEEFGGDEMLNGWLSTKNVIEDKLVFDLLKEDDFPTYILYKAFVNAFKYLNNKK